MMTIHASKMQSSTAAADLRQRAELMAAAAAAAADKVDQEARVPSEACAGAKAQCLLGSQVALVLGGKGASVSDVADLCYMLGRGCASTAMVFAMHQIMVTILVRHAPNSA